jgi:hypothetical protein
MPGGVEMLFNSFGLQAPRVPIMHAGGGGDQQGFQGSPLGTSLLSHIGSGMSITPAGGAAKGLAGMMGMQQNPNLGGLWGGTNDPLSM